MAQHSIHRRFRWRKRQKRFTFVQESRLVDAYIERSKAFGETTNNATAVVVPASPPPQQVRCKPVLRAPTGEKTKTSKGAPNHAANGAEASKHLVVRPLERVRVARAPARLCLVDVALFVTRVVVLHQAVGRPLVREEVLQSERQEPRVELRVLLCELDHVDLFGCRSCVKAW